MLAITVELLHGTIRATGAADTAITGAGDAGEWPPSPARLFCALVAADGTRDRRRLTAGDELLALERAAPPRILAESPSRVLRSLLRERFGVEDESAEGSVQNYPARRAAAVRPGTRLAPASSRITYIWDDLEVDEREHAALTARAARVGYLGCSDSPVRLIIGDNAANEGNTEWVPCDEGTAVLPVPYEGFVSILDEFFDRVQQGEAVRRTWIPNRYIRYGVGAEAEARLTEPTVLWMRLDPAVSGRHIRAVTETLRAALLDRCAMHLGAGSEVPPVIHGHGFDGRGYQHARFLALPDVGHPHARGRLHGAAVLFPAGTPPDVVEGVRAALWGITTLARPGVFETGLRPYGGDSRPVAANPGRWAGPARQWVTATPVVFERYQPQEPGISEVSRWCDHAGIGARPVAVRTSRVPILEGALSLAPPEVHRARDERRPYSHLEVVFDRPVSGPVVLGRGRHFGLGLMAPIDGGRGNG